MMRVFYILRRGISVLKNGTWNVLRGTHKGKNACLVPGMGISSETSMDSLKPIDIVVAAKIAACGTRTYDFLSESLGIARSQIHRAIKRLEARDLCHGDMKIDRKALFVFFAAGLRYVFPAKPGGIVRGTPTGLGLVVQGEPVMVWPKDDGTWTGAGVEPLCKDLRVEDDRKFWEILALIDALRTGVNPKKAAQELKARL